MSTYSAIRQFSENLRLFGDVKENPEKFNLYSGLVNLAKEVDSLKYELSQIKNDIQRINK